MDTKTYAPGRINDLPGLTKLYRRDEDFLIPYPGLFPLQQGWKLSLEAEEFLFLTYFYIEALYTQRKIAALL